MSYSPGRRLWTRSDQARGPLSDLLEGIEEAGTARSSHPK